MSIFNEGDPTTFGNLPPPSIAIDSVIEGVKSTKYNGYAPSAGYKESREAVARYLTKNGSETQLEVSTRQPTVLPYLPFLHLHWRKATADMILGHMVFLPILFKL